MFYRHPWNQEEISRCYKEAYDQDAIDPNRFGGLLLPFIGGLIVGGLFIPKINSQQGQVPYPVYYPPQGYNYPPYPYSPQIMPYPYINTNQ